MNHVPQDRMTEAEEREWLAQERAWREERHHVAASDDPFLASYRQVVRALRAPLPDALPADFARTVAAQCVRPESAASADTRLEERVQRALLVVLAMAAIATTAVYGEQWAHAMADALPVLGSGVAMNWTCALAACLALSWAMERLRQRAVA